MLTNLDRLAERLAASPEFAFRQFYGLPPLDPRFLGMSHWDILVELRALELWREDTGDEEYNRWFQRVQQDPEEFRRTREEDQALIDRLGLGRGKADANGTDTG